MNEIKTFEEMVPDGPTAPPVDTAKYDQRVKRIMSRLRGSDFFTLADGEAVDIVLLSDVDDWIEVPVHRVKAEKGWQRGLCKTWDAIGEEKCEWCDDAKGVRRGLAIALYNYTSEMVQVAFWTMHNDSPLNEIEEAYTTHRVPFRGMKFRISRRGEGIKTRYKMTYLSHVTEGLQAPPTRQQITDVILAVMGPREEDTDTEESK